MSRIKEPIINVSNYRNHIAPVLDGEVKGHGLIPRDYSIYPAEMFDAPRDMKLIPRSEWQARIQEQEARKSRISDILLSGDDGKPIPSLDQGPNGYCWGHSTGGCIQAVRAINGQPYVPLSCYMVCAIIKKGRNEGGWCGLSAKFMREIGICSQKTWPQGDRNTARDTPAVREEAAKYRVHEEWVDLSRDVYDQNLSMDMVVTCLLMNIPVAGDFNWWAHSVLLCDAVWVDGAIAIRFRNSWGDGYGNKGFGVLQGSKAVTNGAVAIRVSGTGL
jgi:hypothetical protein